MAEYIDCADLWGEAFDYIIDNAGSSIAQGFVERVKRIPAADVVEVVRCRDCKYLMYDAIFDEGVCNRLDSPWRVSGDWYCPRGERKDADDGAEL